eukprot:4294381-Pleurochrysis_carterae.AAC.2
MQKHSSMLRLQVEPATATFSQDMGNLEEETRSRLNLASVICVLFFVAAFELGPGPIPWQVQSSPDSALTCTQVLMRNVSKPRIPGKCCQGQSSFGAHSTLITHKYAKTCRGFGIDLLSALVELRICAIDLRFGIAHSRTC